MSDNVTLSNSVTGVNAGERAVTLSHVLSQTLSLHFVSDGNRPARSPSYRRGTLTGFGFWLFSSRSRTLLARLEDTHTYTAVPWNDREAVPRCGTSAERPPCGVEGQTRRFRRASERVANTRTGRRKPPVSCLGRDTNLNGAPCQYSGSAVRTGS